MFSITQVFPQTLLQGEKRYQSLVASSPPCYFQFAMRKSTRLIFRLIFKFSVQQHQLGEVIYLPACPFSFYGAYALYYGVDGYLAYLRPQMFLNELKGLGYFQSNMCYFQMHLPGFIFSPRLVSIYSRSNAVYFQSNMCYFQSNMVYFQSNMCYFQSIFSVYAYIYFQMRCTFRC